MATICADPAKTIQLIENACQAVISPATAAAPQIIPNGMMAIESGMNARTPATNSLRAFWICCIVRIYE